MSLYETVFSNLANPLTFSEESGVVAGSLGVVGTRRHQLPADWPSPLLRFMSPSKPSPRPSAHRAGPGRRTPPLAA
jgi:hypothetical protein